MTRPARPIPDASLDRLAHYHCYIGCIADEPSAPVKLTSRALADALGFTEETVRRDLTFIELVGRPGLGYDLRALYQALGAFLRIEPAHPVVVVGGIDAIRALDTVFPAKQYDLSVVAAFTPDAAEASGEIGGVPVYPLAELRDVDARRGADTAIVAVDPAQIDETLALLVDAGVTSALMLTAAVAVDVPPELNVHQVRIPCVLKSLTCRSRGAGSTPDSAGSECATAK